MSQSLMLGSQELGKNSLLFVSVVFRETELCAFFINKQDYTREMLGLGLSFLLLMEAGL